MTLGPGKKRKAPPSPTARTLAWCRRQGWTAAVVEKWNPHAEIRQDLFGCIDVVALQPGQTGVLGVQATTATNVSHRLAKMVAEPRARVWLECGNRLLLVGWAKQGSGPKKTWTRSERYVTLNDMEAP